MDSRLHWKVVHFLDTISVARWQAVDVSTKTSFEVAEGENVWLTCAEYERDKMVANRALYEGEHRTAILRCHSLCRRSNYAMMSALYVDDVEAASKLSSQLQSACRTCRAHRKVSGLNAHVLLGAFDLRGSSRGTMFRFGVDGRPSIAGLHAGIMEVNLLLDGGGKLMASAMYTTGIAGDSRPLAQASRVRAIVDVASADPKMTMSFREVPLALDGSWCTSMIGRATSRNGSDEYSGRAVVCVLAVLEGGYSEREVSLLKALNLDVCRA
eukprot:TRINITY_DN13702_c0_g1_i1.p1 TRINITY_DN13702_c0_g1~~TRINITY_DN13702_c0_g1_i1.p1  ORF type:complete len:269 (+),score=33.22 TRINITY_DN13702_c0_g1_i1:17-823(+)